MQCASKIPFKISLISDSIPEGNLSVCNISTVNVSCSNKDQLDEDEVWKSRMRVVSDCSHITGTASLWVKIINFAVTLCFRPGLRYPNITVSMIWNMSQRYIICHTCHKTGDMFE